MNICRNCNIYVNDDIDVCPLCHSVLDDDQTEEELVRGNELIHQGSEYPDVRKREKRMNIVMRAILFLFILAEIGLVIINRTVKPNFWWAGICGIAMVYIYSSMVYWIKHDSGFAAKIGLQLVLTMVLLVAIDYYFTGMNGWSLKFAIPGVLLFGDAIVFFLMMLNKQYWYSYSILLLFIGLCSWAIMYLYYIGRISNIVLPAVCAAVTGVFLLGTIIFGDRQFTREMKRRFHV